MAKTMKRIVITAIVLIVIGVGAMVAVMGFGKGTPLEDARNTAINTLINTSGIKTSIENDLRSKASDLSETTGVPLSLLNYGIDTLEIQDWEATSLPDEAVEQETLTFDYQGRPIDIKTYDDPDYLTVRAYGQDVTFKVPDSAQDLTGLLPYIAKAEDAGVADALSSIANSF